MYDISVPPQDQSLVSKEEFLNLSLIPQKLLLQEAKKQNIQVSDAEVDASIDNLRTQLGLTQEQFNEQLKTNKVDINDIKQLYKTRLTITRLINETISQGTKIILPERVRASHILVNTEEEAEAVINELKNGSDFATLAREKSIDPSAKANGGDLGYFSKGVMIPEFENTAFNMKIGDISEPVKTQFGYHVIKLMDKRPEEEKLLSDITDPSELALIGQQQQAIIQTYVNTLRSKASIQIGEGVKAEETKPTTTSFAQCLTEKGAVLYGTDWCNYTGKQKEMFRDDFQYITYVDCDQKADECTAAGITGYPTWVINGKQYQEPQDLKSLSKISGCKI